MVFSVIDSCVKTANHSSFSSHRKKKIILTESAIPLFECPTGLYDKHLAIFENEFQLIFSSTRFSFLVTFDVIITLNSVLQLSFQSGS